MADATVIHCPHCGQAYFVQPHQWAHYQGQTINCTRCGRAFRVMSPAAVRNPVAPPLVTDVAAGTAPATARPPQTQGVPPPVPNPAQGFPPAFPTDPFPPSGYPQPPHPYAGGMYPPPPVRTSGLAIASLILGILSFCLPAIGSLAAVGTAVGGLIGTRDRRAGGRGLAIAGLALGLFTLVIETPIVAMVSVPAMHKGIEAAHRVQCEANIKILAAGLMTYAETHDGKYPAELDDLTQIPSPPPVAAYVCPSDSKSAPASSPPESTAAGINSGEHCSYVYLGSGVKTSDDSRIVILYEPLGNHHFEGMNVLFADGRCQWLSADEAQTLLDQRAAGKRPIRVADTTSP